MGQAWDPQVQALRNSFQCLFFDNRGIGESLPFAKPITVEQLARDVLALADDRNWDEFHLVGHSLGGLTAQFVASLAPDRVRSLSLLCTFATGRDVAKQSWKLVWKGLRTVLGTKSMRRKAFLEFLLPKSLLRSRNLEELADRYAKLLGHDLASQPSIVRHQLAALKGVIEPVLLESLNTIPTLVVSASEDLIASPAAGEFLQRSIHARKFALLTDASHGVPLHSPEIINELLLEHLRFSENYYADS